MRYLPLILLVAVLATLAAIAAGAARADDAGVATSVKKRSLRISPRAATLGTVISPRTSSTKALVSLQSFTKVARQGAAAIATTKPSTKNGAKLKLLAKRAFVNVGDAGALLVKAVQMVRAGKSEVDVTITVNQAVKLANNGSIQLKNATTLLHKIAG